jgi:hypothetical protein
MVKTTVTPSIALHGTSRPRGLVWPVLLLLLLLITAALVPHPHLGVARHAAVTLPSSL